MRKPRDKMRALSVSHEISREPREKGKESHSHVISERAISPGLRRSERNQRDQNKNKSGSRHWDRGNEEVQGGVGGVLGRPVRGIGWGGGPNGGVRGGGQGIRGRVLGVRLWLGAPGGLLGKGPGRGLLIYFLRTFLYFGFV